jgi:hypothetical protein
MGPTGAGLEIEEESDLHSKPSCHYNLLERKHTQTEELRSMAKIKEIFLVREDVKARNGRSMSRSMVPVVAIALYCLAFLSS